MEILALVETWTLYYGVSACINTLRARRNGQHFADIFKPTLFNENVWISIKISLKFVPRSPINNISALVQIMAWRRPAIIWTNHTIVWFFRVPRWYIGPTAMPRAAVTPIAPERNEGAIGCDSRPKHCRRDDIPAWRPNKITLLSLLPLDLTMYNCFISFLCAVQSREER